MATIAELNTGILKLFEHMTNDYEAWLKLAGYYTPEKVAEYKATLGYQHGKTYIKLVRNSSAEGFVCLADNGKFKQGDLLKAASWNAPAKNYARGNVLTGNYGATRWTGVA